MKGAFFQKPYEYQIEIEGESWSQGDELLGSLTLLNHDTKLVDSANFGCHLCFGNTKKIKAKSPDAFTFISSIFFKEEQIDSKQKASMSFNFQLSKDCPISENIGSLYLLCGQRDKPFEGGLLELKITPHKVIRDFKEIFENFFKFKFKALKNKNEFIVASITPPDSTDWTSIQKMNLKTKLSGEELKLDFSFVLKKISYESSVMKTKDSKVEIQKILTKKDYALFGDSPNQDGIMKSINEVLDQVKLKRY